MSCCLRKAIALPFGFAVSLLLTACGGGGAGAPSIPTTGSPSGSSLPQSFQVPHYTIVDLGPGVQPQAINSAGTVAGVNLGPNNTIEFGFVYKNGTLQNLNPLPGDPASGALDINDAGQIVGYSRNLVNATSHAVVFSGQSAQDLGSPSTDTTYNVATAINNSGTIVGYASTPPAIGPCGFATIFVPGGPKEIGSGGEPLAINDSGEMVGAQCEGFPDREIPWAYPKTAPFPPFLCCDAPVINNQANDINASNEIVGVRQDDSGSVRGYIIQSFTNVTDIPAYPDALNSAGVVVGSTASAGTKHAMLYAKGTVYDLNSFTVGQGCTQWVLQEAKDINDSGTIVGTGTLNGQVHGFMLKPQ